MLRDRGTIKWTSMMLPEHVKMIKDWAERDRFEQQEEVDEQSIEEWNNTIKTAIAEKRLVRIVHHDGRIYVENSGLIASVDRMTQSLRLQDGRGKRLVIEFTAIKAIECV
ncbi:YolD-like family protein [Jeotgalibacillus soli]|uniref:YolD-like protein n=1 Tax=Jeotgalibacillus soli TaxID=889306 RepID=A0A0C2VJV5_9BACL|nr:YolD-like family protein [Jeotgalibacillus soli]KIL44278.1 hypothetical protein KP78_32420 [Jeotgalibacillus soli]